MSVAPNPDPTPSTIPTVEENAYSTATLVHRKAECCNKPGIIKLKCTKPSLTRCQTPYPQTLVVTRATIADWLVY